MMPHWYLQNCIVGCLGGEESIDQDLCVLRVCLDLGVGGGGFTCHRAQSLLPAHKSPGSTDPRSPIHPASDCLQQQSKSFISSPELPNAETSQKKPTSNQLRAAVFGGIYSMNSRAHSMRTSNVVHIVIVHSAGVRPGLDDFGIPVLAIAPAAVHERSQR